jgi:hypothetical protein
MALDALDRVRTAMSIELPPFMAGLVGGVIGWFVTQFVAEPLRRFFVMRREIAQHLLDYENVVAPRNERGEITEYFTGQDAPRLYDAQKQLRQLGTQMLSFVQTDALAANMIRWLWRYDPTKAGRSLMALSHDIAVFGDERARRRSDIIAALRVQSQRTATS